MSKKHKHHNQPVQQPHYSNLDLSLWRKVIIGISLFIFPIIIPPIFKEGIFSGHDITIHLVYLRLFTDALLQGQFPVRWIEWIAPGLNQPLFNFYQPLFYYLFQIPHFLGFSFSTSLKLLILVLWLLSGYFMYLFTKANYNETGGTPGRTPDSAQFVRSEARLERALAGRKGGTGPVATFAGLIAAIFYMFAPYHILDLFVRAAFPEFTALAFVPLLFWSIKRFADTQKGYYLPISAFTTAAIITSHPPTLLMFSPLIFLYIVYLAWQQQSIRFFVLSTISMTLGFCISSFFLIPTLLEQQFIQATFLKSGYYDFHIHFACLPQLFIPYWDYGISSPHCNDGMSFQLGIAQWIVVITTIYFIVSQYRKTHSNESIILPFLFLSSCLLALFMTLAFSQSIWESLPPLAFVQYPWRFLAVGIFTTAFLAGNFLQYFKKETHTYVAYSVLVLIAVVSSYIYLHPQTYLKKDQIDFDSKEFPKGTYFEQGNILPELGYIPKNAEVSILPISEEAKKNPVLASGIKVLTEKAKIDILTNTPTQKSYSIVTNNNTDILFPIHYFPGWKFVFDGKELPLPSKQDNLSYDNMYGFIQKTIPPGKHTVLLQFENTPIRSFANTLTVISSLSSIFLVLIRKKDE